MPLNILFTKEIDHDYLKTELGNITDYKCLPTLEIKLREEYLIQSEIIADIPHYIVTSQNTVKAIENLKIEGDFYVVGEKTAQKLRAQGRNVVLKANYAKDLIALIYEKPTVNSWNLLCGSKRRETIMDGLSAKQHHINEVICYYSNPIYYQINQVFDGYAFFSPLSFSTFIKKNEIPKKAIIFSVGDTTTEEIKRKINNEIITANIPLVEKVVDNIKKYIYDQK